jgi:hypothetical protein
MFYSKKQKQTRNRKKNIQTRNRKKNIQTRNRKKNIQTRNRKKVLINYIGGEPPIIYKYIKHINRNDIERYNHQNTLANQFNQLPFTPIVIQNALQSLKINNFSIINLINYLKVHNKILVIFSSDENTFGYIVFFVIDNDLEFISFVTQDDFLDFINSNINHVYTITEYFGTKLFHHIRM